MVIRKPYAFLIKNFRLIHAVLFGLLVYIITKTFDIYSFFGNYAKTHIYISTNSLAKTYVPTLLFIITIIAIIVTFIIYYILSIKQKSNKTYLFIFLYYLILVFYFVYVRNVFLGLEETSMDVESIRAMRDISIIIIIPQIVILFILIGRTLGFNLKQFDFKKDLEELEIDTSDNEEVEVTIGNDTYKITRFFRKLLRLTKYFVLENKVFVIGSMSIIVLGISFHFINKLNVYKETYRENQIINASSLSFKINTSYITQADKNNIIISNGKHYILVDVLISNKTRENTSINRDTFRLLVNNELLLPSFNYSNRFTDIGEVFSPFKLKAGEDANRLIVFEINSSALSNQYLFKINNLINAGNSNQYRDVLISPNSLNNNIDEGNFTIPNKVELTSSILKKSTVFISSVEFAGKFKEEYTYTINGEEKTAIYSIVPEATNKGEVVILKIKANIKMDESVYMSNIIKYPGDLFEQYGLIRYRYQGNYKTIKLNKMNVNFDKDNYCYMEITKEVLSANKVDLILLIRGVKYTFNLK